MKPVVALVSALLLSFSLFAQEKIEREISGPLDVKVKLNEAQKKQSIMRDITSVYNRVFGVDDFFAKSIDFSLWNGKDGLVKRVRAYVKWRSVLDPRLKSAMTKVRFCSDQIERTIRDVYVAKATLSDAAKSKFGTRFVELRQEMDDVVTELGSLQFKGLLKEKRNDVRDVVKNLALHVQNIAITANKHLKVQ